MRRIGSKYEAPTLRTESLEMHAAVPDVVQTLIDIAGGDAAKPSERITAA